MLLLQATAARHWSFAQDYHIKRTVGQQKYCLLVITQPWLFTRINNLLSYHQRDDNSLQIGSSQSQAVLVEGGVARTEEKELHKSVASYHKMRQLNIGMQCINQLPCRVTKSLFNSLIPFWLFEIVLYMYNTNWKIELNYSHLNRKLYLNNIVLIKS